MPIKTSDKQLADELKAKTTAPKNGKSSTTKESAKAGASRISDFVNDVSNRAARQVADAITAATIQKAMLLLGEGDGELTQAAMSQFSEVFTQVLVEDLPSLTCADGGNSHLFLPSASDSPKKPESLN